MGDTKTPVFAFDLFRLDPAKRLLTRDGQSVALTPKEFDTLLVLVEANGSVVDKEELIARVWRDSYVGDGSLARNISVLRKALGDGVIETHRGRGYRITPSVVSTDSSGAPASTGVPGEGPAVAKVRQKLWSRRTAGFVLATALLILALFVLNRAKPHAFATVAPIRSILIQKEGALDPLDEGFRQKIFVGDELHAHGRAQYSLVLYNRETNGWDRWRVATSDQYYYYRPLSLPEEDFALQRDWKLTCVCALESGAGEADIDFGRKGPRFDMLLLQEGNRYFIGLTKQISPTIEFEQKIEFAGVADVVHPHTYELRYDHITKTDSLWIDGKQMASGYRGHHQFQEDNGLMFGVAIYGNVPKSSAVFREVRFEAD